MNPTVLSLCDRTGNMVQPWVHAGYNAVTVDLKPQNGGLPTCTAYVKEGAAYRCDKTIDMFTA